MAASTWKTKTIKIPSNCNFSSFSAKSRSYWTGNRHKTGFYQPPSSPRYNRLNEAIKKAASAAVQAAVSAFSGSSTPVIAPPMPARVPSWNDALQTSSPGTSASPANHSATDTAMDSVHQLPAKLVKEILTGEFMELSKLLPKNFNVLSPSPDEPLTLTLENSVIKVNKAKATSITDITEWTTAFTAYMGVIS